MTTTPPTPQEQMQQAQAAYVKFDDGQKLTDAENLQDKLAIFKSLSGNPSAMLIYFFSVIMVANKVPHGPFAGNGSSVTRNQENKLTEVSKELNYASAYRETVSQIKQQLELGKSKAGGGDPALVLADVIAMEKYRTSGFTKNAPQIFQGSDDTFKGAEGKLKAVIAAVKKDYGGSFSKLWAAAKVKGDTSAGELIQTYTSATDTLFSAVGVQQNVLNTQLQDIESTYKSYLATATQAMKSFFTVITNAIQKSTTS